MILHSYHLQTCLTSYYVNCLPEPSCLPSSETRELQEWVRSVYKSVPEMKILGLGTGHTLLAEAFGGEVVTNSTYWSAGVRTLEVNENCQAMIKLDQPMEQPGSKVATTIVGPTHMIPRNSAEMSCLAFRLSTVCTVRRSSNHPPVSRTFASIKVITSKA